MAETRFELIVVGGGLTGLTLAIACASAGTAVAVIDREDPAAMLDEPFDGRTTAMSATSRSATSSRTASCGAPSWSGPPPCRASLISRRRR